MEKLITIDEEELMNTPLKQIQFVVDGFISEGLHILAGSPKIGKSFMALSMADKVAKGEDLWNLKTKPGTVLYLCLEDNDARIQSRLFEITDKSTRNLHFSMKSETIAKGLVNQIEEFLENHEDTVLIIIDTLQKIRDEVNTSNQYAADYKELNAL